MWKEARFFMTNIGNDWDALLAEEFEKDYYWKLEAFLTEEYANYTVYPPRGDIFNALRAASYADTKVVILGRTLTTSRGRRMACAFRSTRCQAAAVAGQYLQGARKRPRDPAAPHGYLRPWAEQGVLLLNTSLTVRESMPNSHKDKGWEDFHRSYHCPAERAAKADGVYPVGRER